MKRMSETAKTEWETICQHSRDLKETKDCAVKAVTVVTGVHYVDVHGLMQAKGRKRRKGTCNSITYAVLDQLGFYTVDVKVRSKTVNTLGREMKWRPGVYLVWTRGHILAVKGGEVLDWTNGRRHRVLRVEQVLRKHTNALAAKAEK